MKKQYSNPNTEISWWVGDNLCDSPLYDGTPPHPGTGGKGPAFTLPGSADK